MLKLINSNIIYRYNTRDREGESTQVVDIILEKKKENHQIICSAYWFLT